MANDKTGHYEIVRSMYADISHKHTLALFLEKHKFSNVAKSTPSISKTEIGDCWVKSNRIWGIQMFVLTNRFRTGGRNGVYKPMEFCSDQGEHFFSRCTFLENC